MKATLLRTGALVLPVIAGATSWFVASHLTNATTGNVSKGFLAIFTLLIGFAVFMLKEVQQIGSSGVLSNVGLDRLRRARKIAQVRTLLLVGIGAVGVIAASLATFVEVELRLVRAICFAIALCALIILFVISIVYLPMLYFDLQTARDKLDDWREADASRRRQIEALATSSSARETGA